MLSHSGAHSEREIRAEHLTNVPQGRPIIFVVHSAGGLVIKRAVMRCQNIPHLRDIKSSIYGIIFLGTPHYGSELAGDLSTVQNIYATVTRKNPSAFTKEIRTFSSTIVDINDEFGYLLPSLSLYCFYETLPMKLPSASKGVKSDLVSR